MNSQPRFPRTPRRKGALLLETAAGGALLAIAFVLLLRLVGWVAAERRDADRRQAAVSLASNVLERLATQPPRSWKSRSEPVSSIEPETARLLPGGTVKIAFDGSEQDGLKRVQVSVSWTGSPSPQRLSAWLSTRRRTP
jgi:hypothetical protein